MTIRSRTIIALVAAGAVIAGAGACSSDDDEASAESTTTTSAASTTPEEPTSDLTEFCDLASELNGATPTQEQIDEYSALAPDEISEPVETFAAAFTAADGDLGAVFADPDAAAASEEIAAFESEQCGITPPGPPAGAGE
jgi:ABC-type glycerol-3-phosphate transport system substrate-binding protein